MAAATQLPTPAFGTQTPVDEEASRAAPRRTGTDLEPLQGGGALLEAPALGAVLDACPLPIIITDREGTVVRVNRAAVEQLPLDPAFALGQARGAPLQAAFTAELPWGALARRARGGAPAQLGVELHDGARPRRWEVSVRATDDGAALVWHWQPGANTDVAGTARAGARMAADERSPEIAPDVQLLRRAVRRLELVQAAFVATSVPAVIVDRRGWPIELNAAFARWTGYGRDELFVLGGFEALMDDLDGSSAEGGGEVQVLALHPLTPPCFASLVERAPVRMRARLRRRAGDVREVTLAVDPLRDRDGGLLALVVSLQDLDASADTADSREGAASPSQPVSPIC